MDDNSEKSKLEIRKLEQEIDKIDLEKIKINNEVEKVSLEVKDLRARWLKFCVTVAAPVIVAAIGYLLVYQSRYFDTVRSELGAVKNNLEATNTYFKIAQDSFRRDTTNYSRTRRLIQDSISIFHDSIVDLYKTINRLENISAETISKMDAIKKKYAQQLLGLQNGNRLMLDSITYFQAELDRNRMKVDSMKALNIGYKTGQDAFMHDRDNVLNDLRAAQGVISSLREQLKKCQELH